MKPLRCSLIAGRLERDRLEFLGEGYPQILLELGFKPHTCAILQACAIRESKRWYAY